MEGWLLVGKRVVGLVEGVLLGESVVGYREGDIITGAMVAKPEAGEEAEKIGDIAGELEDFKVGIEVDGLNDGSGVGFLVGEGGNVGEALNKPDAILGADGEGATGTAVEGAKGTEVDGVIGTGVGGDPRQK